MTHTENLAWAKAEYEKAVLNWQKRESSADAAYGAAQSLKKIAAEAWRAKEAAREKYNSIKNELPT